MFAMDSLCPVPSSCQQSQLLGRSCHAHASVLADLHLDSLLKEENLLFDGRAVNSRWADINRSRPAISLLRPVAVPVHLPAKLEGPTYPSEGQPSPQQTEYQPRCFQARSQVLEVRQ